jgi:hypothetical protein
MKVFLSWSGEKSHLMAIALREWLPSVIQAIDPYVSSEDIDKGTRWASDIASELDLSTFGILCITKENLEAPWVNFEAGALSKSLDKSRVCPILLDIKRSEVQGPLLQFQSTLVEQEDFFKLVSSLNSSLKSGSLDEARLRKSFDNWWISLVDKVNEIIKVDSKVEKKNSTEHKSEILEELLDLARSQQKLLRNPEEILPIQYLNYALNRTEKFHSIDSKHPIWDDLFSNIRELELMIRSSQDFDILDAHFKDTYRIFDYISGRFDIRFSPNRELKSPKRGKISTSKISADPPIKSPIAEE